ncbi:MAG: sigma-70 family RNA polymerase sigma factor [bacterium]
MTKTVPELVESFVDGDQEAFTELVRRYQKKIYSLAYQVLGNHLDADEVVQETFVRIYKKRKELRDVKYFSTFLLRIAGNYSIDLLRRRKGHTRISDQVSLPGSVQLDMSRRIATPSEDFENKELMEEIKKALERLPPRQRLTAILHDIEGYSKAEIAEALDSPEATVRSNLHIARRKLKKILTQRFKGRREEQK